MSSHKNRHSSFSFLGRDSVGGGFAEGSISERRIGAFSGSPNHCYCTQTKLQLRPCCRSPCTGSCPDTHRADLYESVYHRPTLKKGSDRSLSGVRALIAPLQPPQRCRATIPIVRCDMQSSPRRVYLSPDQLALACFSSPPPKIKIDCDS